MSYAIAFDWPDVPEPVYAARVGDSLGWAFSVADEATLICETEEEAGRWLANGYPSNSRFGYIIDAESGEKIR